MSVISGYEHYVANAQLIIAIATASYFINAYAGEAAALQSRGYSVKYLFFVALFANSLAVGVEKFLTLTFGSEGSTPEFFWLCAFVFVFLSSFLIPRKKRK